MSATTTSFAASPPAVPRMTDAVAAPPAVPFLDLRAPYQELRTEMDAAIGRVLESGWYLLGEPLREFEQAYAAYVGARHCVGVANGLDALRLGLMALDVERGDEVIVPSNTYIATWLAVTELGAVPVPVEPDPRTYNLDPERVAAAITSRTRAILPVHLYGQPADLDALRAIGEQHGVRVLDDAAQAHGAAVRGRHVGGSGLADVTAWSFYPGKNLGALGDGGAITTDDDRIADRVRVLRNYGSRVKYVNEVVGLNSRLDDIQAAVLQVKLAHLDAWNERRTAQAARYREAFAELPLTLPCVPEFAHPSWHLFVVETERRDALQQELSARGIGTIIHYPIPPHRQQAYASLGFAADAFPLASRIAERVLSLPIGPHLTDAQQRRVIDAVCGFDFGGA
jgi:dTDP-4-amino-4,6-dideoxygalactose transaminase